jgi:hypothetical protein
MYRKFIATVTAASIALTALGTAPAAAADQRQTANAIAAIIGLAVVGKLIHDRKDRDKQEVHHKPQHKPQPVHPKPQQIERHPKPHTPSFQTQRLDQPTPRPLPQRASRKLLPRECLRSFDTRRGKVRMFPNLCLTRNYAQAHRLPQKCFYVFNTRKGERRGYEAQCLRERGFRLARG